MSTLRHPIRLAEYSEGKSYPRELTELNGKLHIQNSDGTNSILNKTTPIYYIDSKTKEKTLIGNVDPSTGNEIDFTDSDETTAGLVKLSANTPKAAGTASAGSDSSVARADHVHPAQTSVSGNAGTASKLQAARSIGLGGVTATAQDFDGSEDITIPITAVPATIVTGLASVATSGKYSDLNGKPTIPSAASDSDTPKSAGTASVGSSNAYAKADHVHPAQTSVSGNAGSASKLQTSRSIGVSGAISGTAQGFDGSKDITIPITSIDGTKITGIIPLSSIPKGAQERLVPVKDDAARLALTSDDAQNGDVVKVQSTGIMYYIVDDTKLGTAAPEGAFEVFTAGAASSVDWTGISNKPTFATVATSGSYTDLDNKPTIPSSATASDTPKAAGTAAVGSSNAYAKADHVHPVQTSVSGNAGTATKLKASKSIGLSGVTATAQDFDGSKDITIPITAVPASIVTGLATVATSGKYSDLNGKPTIPSASTSSDTPEAAGTAAIGTSAAYARADHVHPAQTSVSGNAGTATKLKASKSIGLGGVTATAQSFDGSKDITIPITAVPASIVTGLATVATSGKYSDLNGAPDVPSAATKDPVVIGTASVGTSAKYAREDHSHAHNTIARSDTDSSVTPSKGSTFTAIDSVTTNNGHVTAINEKTITIPKDSFGRTDTTSTSTAYTVTVNDLDALEDGKIIYVMFHVTNGANATLNVNNLGAKSIYYKGSAIRTGTIPNDVIIPMMYFNDGWMITANYNSITDLGFGYVYCSTNYNIQAKTATLAGFELRTGAVLTVRFVHGVPAASTLNINNTGAKQIYHNGVRMTDGVIKDGDTAMFVYNGTQYLLASVSRCSNTYTTNITTTWTGSAAPYSQTITVTGISANDNPVVDLVPSTTYATAQAQMADYGKIYKITTSLNSITVYATEKTDVALPIQLKCIKN